MQSNQLTPDQLRTALEKHGLPIYGSDEELQVRYDRNELGGKKEAKLPAAKTFRAKAKSKDVADDGTEVQTDVDNQLLANRASSEAVEILPEVEEVTSDNINTFQ